MSRLVLDRRVLSRDDAMALGQRLLSLVNDHSVGVAVEHVVHSVTRVSNGTVLNTDDGDQVRITFQSRFGSGLPVSINTNQLSDAMLRRVVEQARVIAPLTPSSQKMMPDDRDDPTYFTFNAREFPKVALWHDNTVRAMETARGDVIPELGEQVRRSQLSGAATVGFSARSVLYLYQQGLTAFAEDTDCEVTVTARTPDGKSSGWSGQAQRDWARITPNTIATRAIELATQGRNAVALEPGRRMAILGPGAIAPLMFWMASAFDGARARGEPGTPLSLPNRRSRGRRTKVGLRVLDPRIRMISDPADPDGGFPPFFEMGGAESLWGYPTPSITWIEEGVLKSLSYRVQDAVARGVPAAPEPFSVRLDTMRGTKTATLDEMIANCQEGVYINRLSNVRLVDEVSGMMTGVSRDGCFLVKNGKITKPLKNFRFIDSPFFAFNRLEMIGTAERVAFGTSAPPGRGEGRWPRRPVIVPAMMIRDFNFSAISDAV